MANPSRFDLDANIKRFAVDVVNESIQKAFDLNVLSSMQHTTLQAVVREEAHEMVLRLSQRMVGTGKRHIKWSVRYPLTWWDHWKHALGLKRRRWWRRWLLKRLKPVEWKNRHFEDVRYENICPHMPTDKQQYHIEFLMHGREETPGHVSMGTVIRDLRFIQQDMADARNVLYHDIIARSFDSAITYLEGRYS